MTQTLMDAGAGYTGAPSRGTHLKHPWTQLKAPDQMDWSIYIYIYKLIYLSIYFSLIFLGSAAFFSSNYIELNQFKLIGFGWNDGEAGLVMIYASARRRKFVFIFASVRKSQLGATFRPVCASLLSVSPKVSVAMTSESSTPVVQ